MPWNALFDFFSQTKKRKKEMEKKTLYIITNNCQLALYFSPPIMMAPKENCVPENYTLSPGILNKSEEQLEWHSKREPKVKWHLSRDQWTRGAFVFKCRRRWWLNLMISYWTSSELFACRLIIPTGLAGRSIRQRFVDFNNFGMAHKKFSVSSYTSPSPHFLSPFYIAFSLLKVKFLAVLAH